ncbi:Hypothetical predicted protein [Mytilus galloprovincialis]|uniref:Uncharacterized protein n=1 Tax=Mytilus galloprovincialis TaxID=29158 RepID=A0A8B6DQI8_MYTGA|nr:Hypothetical predicted protein [Mytilus galloprovincialis]
MSSKLFTVLVLVCVFWLENANAWWGRDNSYVVNRSDQSIHVSLRHGGHTTTRTVGSGSYTKIETGKYHSITLCVDYSICSNAGSDTSFIVDEYRGSLRIFKSVYGDIHSIDWGKK